MVMMPAYQIKKSARIADPGLKHAGTSFSPWGDKKGESRFSPRSLF